MRFAAITVDVDRDVNLAQKGEIKAASRAVNGDASARFASSARGLKFIVEILNDLDIKGTFFMEAETAERISGSIDLPGLMVGHEIAGHGYGHEDLTGDSTNVPFGPDDIGQVIDTCTSSLEGLFGRRPVGFRAPYLHTSDAVVDALKQRGYLYDSSVIRPLEDGRIGPWRRPNGLWEVPLAQGIDSRGKKLQSYLWPLHEGKRLVSDYDLLFSQFKEGLLVLGDHSWHIVERRDGPVPEDSIGRNVAELRTFLQGALGQGIEFITLETFVRREAER